MNKMKSVALIGYPCLTPEVTLIELEMLDEFVSANCCRSVNLIQFFPLFVHIIAVCEKISANLFLVHVKKNHRTLCSYLVSYKKTTIVIIYLMVEIKMNSFSIKQLYPTFILKLYYNIQNHFNLWKSH